jgi:hypothetical protein
MAIKARKIPKVAADSYSCVGWRGIPSGARLFGFLNVQAHGTSVGNP